MVLLIIGFFVFLLAVLRKDRMLVGEFVLGLGLVSYIWFFPILVMIFSGICLYQCRHMKQKMACVLLPIIAVVGAGLVIIVWFFGSSYLLGILMLTVAVAVSACISYFLCWREGTPNILRVFPIFLIVVLFLVIPPFFREVLPYIYTPQVLTKDNLPLYRECINFAKKYEKYNDIILYLRRWESPEHKIGYEPVADVLFGTDRLMKFITKDEYNRITYDAIRLSGKLNATLCWKMQRNNNILLFFKDSNHILPSGLGVAYSLDGNNPNDLYSDIINPAKPFTKIAGNWYISKRLASRGVRESLLTEIPKSIIDRSLFLEGVDPNKLEDSN